MRIYPGTTVDSEFGTLGDLGYTGTLNDRQFSFLRDEGLTLALPDMFSQYATGGGGGGGGGPQPVTFASFEALGIGGGGSNQNSFTSFTPQDIGVADPDRWVIAGLYLNYNTARTLGSVTIGGVSATLMYATPDLGASDGSRVEYWKANVPTGTTATVVVTATSGLMYDGTSGLWVAYAEPIFSAGAFDNTYSGTTLSVTIDVPDDGAVIAMAANPGVNGRTVTAISGVALDFTSSTYSTAGASEDLLAAETGRTVSVTWDAVAAVPRFFGLGVMSVSF